MLVLNVIQGPDKGKRFELPDNEPQLIGRSSESLVLSDMTISRRHAELTPDEGRWYLNDLKSANGTYINGERLTEPVLLNAGDQIRAGQTLFVFGRVPQGLRWQDEAIRVVRPDAMDTAVESTFLSSDDSVIMAVPDPSAAAAEQLSVIYQLMQVVSSTFERDVLLERVMDLIFRYFESDRGFILLQESPDDPHDPVVVRYRRNPRTEAERKIHVSRTIVQHVLRKGEGVLSSNAMTDSRFSAGESVQAFGIRSAICVPMKSHARTYGVIYIDSQVANYTYTEDQLRLMAAIGAQTGLALSNAELYHQGLLTERLAAVGETVASLSHSIRNMLQGMRGGAEVVELGIRKNDMNIVRNGWAVLSRNLVRIYELTMNMLAYSKRRKPEMEMVHLNALLKEMAESMQPFFDHRTVALITELDEEMPPIPADPGGLNQAITNLLNNALDAVEPASGVVTLRCGYDPIQHVAIITVSDNGSGIERQNLTNIFQPFYSTKGQRGTGLGLTVTKKIIDEHQGRIQVHSEPNKGTTFTIALSTQSLHDPSETAA